MDKERNGDNPEKTHKRRCFIIAEAGVNHNGDLALAKQLVSAAATAGADAVKFQSFHAAEVAAPSAHQAVYQQSRSKASSQVDMLRRLELDREAHVLLLEQCIDEGVEFLSTPFDRPSADLLVELGVPMIKIGSGELTNLPFLDYVARLGRPMILSTGMATLAEVDEAVSTIEAAGLKDLILLHCVSNYPAKPADVNLRAMGTMSSAWGYPVGYSDHTTGNEVALAAVALGAAVIEKHFTLDCLLPGPDHQASIEPREFKRLVEGIRRVEAALGDGRKVPASSEQEIADVARRSLVAATDIPCGETVLSRDVAILRPGTGLPPRMLPFIVGKTARVDIAKGRLLELGMVE